MTFSNKIYDILKWVTQVLLPAISTLYVALAQVWGFPLGEEISATLMAIVLFLGIVLQISSSNYRLVTFKDNLIYNAPLVEKPYSEMPNPNDVYSHPEQLGSNLGSDIKDSNPNK